MCRASGTDTEEASFEPSHSGLYSPGLARNTIRVCVFLTHFLLFNVRRSGKTLSCPGGLHLQFPLTRRDGVLGRSTRGQGFVQPVCMGTGDRVNGQEP